MAKDKERATAFNLYVNECKTAKEIAALLHVQEKTVGGWVKEGDWKNLRLSKQSTTNTLVNNSYELLSSLLERRLIFEKKSQRSDEEKEDYRNIIDEMSKVAAMIDRLQKEGRVSLRTHIHCIEKFMGFLNQSDPKAFNSLLDFQREYFIQLAEELK